MNSFNKIENNKNKENFTKIKLKCFFDNIKSKFILKRIFNNLHERKALQIMKPSKKMQNKMSINLINYKTFSNIEIDIIPAENQCGKIIQINKEEEKPYYHIYFNNNLNEEIKKDFFDENDKVFKIKIIIENPVKSLTKLFLYCKYIESIYFKKFYRRNIYDMSNMFFGCSSLKEINFSNFNSINVTNMSYMFYGCSSLKKLDLSNFVTNNVINMSNMFYGCRELKEVEICSFNTERVINMNHMFSWCSSLEKINISNFIFNKSIDVSWMFNSCKKGLKLKIKEQNKNIKESAFS